VLSAAEARQMLDSIQSSTLTTIFQLIARLTVSLLSTSGDYEATVTPTDLHSFDSQVTCRDARNSTWNLHGLVAR